MSVESAQRRNLDLTRIYSQIASAASSPERLLLRPLLNTHTFAMAASASRPRDLSQMVGALSNLGEHAASRISIMGPATARLLDEQARLLAEQPDIWDAANNSDQDALEAILKEVLEIRHWRSLIIPAANSYHYMAP